MTKWGNPPNMGICVACFIRDIAGALGLHRNDTTQYIRPEVIGFLLGAFITSMKGFLEALLRGNNTRKLKHHGFRFRILFPVPRLLSLGEGIPSRFERRPPCQGSQDAPAHKSPPQKGDVRRTGESDTSQLCCGVKWLPSARGSPLAVLRTSFPRRGQEATIEQRLPLPPPGERD
jgi:hypothetical protein